MSEKITDNEDGHSSGVTGVVACFSNENDVILKREREKIYKPNFAGRMFGRYL